MSVKAMALEYLNLLNCSVYRLVSLKCGSAGENQGYKNVIYKNSMKIFGLAWVERHGGGYSLFQIHKKMVAKTKDKK